MAQQSLLVIATCPPPARHQLRFRRSQAGRACRPKGRLDTQAWQIPPCPPFIKGGLGGFSEIAFRPRDLWASNVIMKHSQIARCGI